MEFNSTLFVQMINFGITYFFMRVFFFKPIVALLLSKEKEVIAIKAGITQRKNRLEKNKREIAHQWEVTRGLFAKKRPDVTRLILLRSAECHLSPSMQTEQEIEKTKEHIVHAITKEVLNVH